MQSISYYPDIQGDCDLLSFWTPKDFQPAFALTQVDRLITVESQTVCLGWTRVRQCTVCANLS